MLLQDHRRITGLLEDLDCEERPAEMRRLCRDIVAEIAGHEAAEDDVVFPALRAAVPAAEHELIERFDEHREVNELLAGMAAIDPAGVGFLKRAAALIYELREHFAAEEEELFPRLRAVLPQQELLALGERFAEAKRHAPDLLRHPDVTGHLCQQPAWLSIAAALATITLKTPSPDPSGSCPTPWSRS
jgi:hemerythrin superfamily protein